jgi:signal transduction histidine kinase
MLRPVSRITSTARRVAAGVDLSQRIAAQGPNDELRELAETIDEMLERLERAFASQRSFVANASHELRTPLAVLRAEVEDRLDDPAVGEAELREMVTVVQEAIERVEQVIASLLTLARSHNGLIRHEPVELLAIAEGVAERLQSRAVASGIRIAVHGDPAMLEGDRDLIERLVENLLENGTRYNREDGFVAAAIELDGSTARLLVVNSGPKVAADVAPRLFEPFFRTDESRSRDSGGAGLGLSIVAAVASAHGGEATAIARPDGGLVVTVNFPTAPATFVESPYDERRRPLTSALPPST